MSELMRLNRFLAQCGLGSRRSVEQFITKGQVLVNGAVAQDLSRKVDLQHDEVHVLLDEKDNQKQGGKKIRAVPRTHCIVYALHKPTGYICSRKDPKNKSASVYNLLPLKYIRLNSIGRLDVNTSGLLLFTNDGILAHRLTHPAFEIKRVYQASLRQKFKPRDMEALNQGVMIQGRRTSPPKIKKVSPDHLEIVLEIKEGRNREVRRLIQATGNHVVNLHRQSFAGLDLGSIPQGRGRALYEDEILSLRKQVGLLSP